MNWYDFIVALVQNSLTFGRHRSFDSFSLDSFSWAGGGIFLQDRRVSGGDRAASSTSIDCTVTTQSTTILYQ